MQLQNSDERVAFNIFELSERLQNIKYQESSI